MLTETSARQQLTRVWQGRAALAPMTMARQEPRGRGPALERARVELHPQKHMPPQALGSGSGSGPA